MNAHEIKDFQQIAATPEGQNFLRALCQEVLGYHAGPLALNKMHDLAPNVMIAHDAIRGIWSELRQYLPLADLVQIELRRQGESPELTQDVQPLTKDGQQWQTTRQELQQQTQELIQEQTQEQDQEMAHRTRGVSPTTELS